MTTQEAKKQTFMPAHTLMDGEGVLQQQQRLSLGPDTGIAKDLALTQFDYLRAAKGQYMQQQPKRPVAEVNLLTAHYYGRPSFDI